MKYYETRRLFYKKYLYKLTINTRLARLFSTDVSAHKFDFARRTLETLTPGKYDLKTLKTLTIGGWRRHINIGPQCINDANALYKNFTSELDDFKLRCSMQNIIIYSNHPEFLEQIMRDVNDDSLVSYYQPNENAVNVLTAEPDIIVSSEPVEYQYKISLKFDRRRTPALANWIDKNKNKIRIGKYASENIKFGLYYDAYFYVKDSKTLMLVQLSFNDLIKKTEQLVYVQSDK